MSEQVNWGYDERHYALFTDGNGLFQWRWIDHRAGEEDAVSPIFKSKEEAVAWADARCTTKVLSVATHSWKRIEV